MYGTQRPNVVWNATQSAVAVYGAKHEDKNHMAQPKTNLCDATPAITLNGNSSRQPVFASPLPLLFLLIVLWAASALYCSGYEVMRLSPMTLKFSDSFTYFMFESDARPGRTRPDRSEYY